MAIWIYLLLHLAIVLGCVYWARAKGHPVLLLGLLACLVGPILLLALPFVKPPSWQPTPVVLPPTAHDASFSAAAGRLGGYTAPGQAPTPARPGHEPIYMPFLLNGIGIGILLLVALGASGSDKLVVFFIFVPLLTLANSILFLWAFAKRASGLALLYALPALTGLSLLVYVVTQLGHR